MIVQHSLLEPPSTDPTPIYRYRDGLYAADLLTAALVHLDLFSFLDRQPATIQTICDQLQLQARPTDVMLTLFTAMGLVRSRQGVFEVTPLAREHLVQSSAWNIEPYFASLKERPVCRDMVTVLRTGKPAAWASVQTEKEWARAMEEEGFATRFTAAMDCRGVFLGPAMAQRLNCRNHQHLLDIAGGSGIYSCAILARHPHLRATVLEKPPVDRITCGCLTMRGFADRISVHVADMFKDPFPAGCDIHLFSNVLHDWDVPKVEQLITKSYDSLPRGGQIVVHDAHINADKTGPLPVAAYSALLMTITEGKCYSETEMSYLLSRAGFSDIRYSPTAADRSIIVAHKP